MRPDIRALLIAAAVAIAVAGEIGLYLGGEPVWYLALDAAVAATYMVAGIFAWSARRRRVGGLLGLTGALWSLSGLVYLPVPWLVSIGTLVMYLNNPVFGHLLLGYPTGRVTGPVAVGLVAVGYAFNLGENLVFTFVRHPAPPFGAWEVISAPWAVDAMSDIAGLFVPILAAGYLVVLARRAIRASPAARRTLRPLWAVGVILVAVYILSFVPYWVDVGASADLALTAVNTALNLPIPIILLVGLRRSRAQRGIAGALAETLGSGPSAPARLQEELSRALRDPNLELALWDEAADGYRGTDGRIVDGRPPGGEREVTAVSAGDRPLGLLLHDRAILAEREILDAVVAVLRLALENERLRLAIAARLEDVSASRMRIVEAALAERRRLERDLHDGAQQRLVSSALGLRMAIEGLDGDGDARSSLEAVASELNDAIAELRSLARGIHPPILTDAGLGAALASLADRSPVPATVEIALDERLPAPVEATAYFVAAEALTNVTRHAEAGAASITARIVDGWLVLTVSDDGRGGAVSTPGSGLSGLSDRVAALHGRLSLESRPGAGTTVRVELPCAS